MGKILSPFKPVAVTSLPAASSHTGEIFSCANLLYISNGTKWNQFNLFRENDFPGCNVPGATYFQLQSLGNAASTTVDLSGPPSGKRWKVLRVLLFGTTNSSGALKLKNSGSYYQFTAIQIFNNPSQFPILEYGDTLSFVTNSTGTLYNFFATIMEFSTEYPMFSPRLLTLSSGNNTLYTCPTGCQAKVLTPNPNSGSSQAAGTTFDGPFYVHYTNQSGSTRTYYVNHVLSGDTPQAPSANSSTNSSFPTTLTLATGSASAVLIPHFMEAGDFINFNTDASGAQYVYVNIIEYPKVS